VIHSASELIASASASAEHVAAVADAVTTVRATRPTRWPLVPAPTAALQPAPSNSPARHGQISHACPIAARLAVVAARLPPPPDHRRRSTVVHRQNFPGLRTPPSGRSSPHLHPVGATSPPIPDPIPSPSKRIFRKSLFERVLSMLRSQRERRRDGTVGGLAPGRERAQRLRRTGTACPGAPGAAGALRSPRGEPEPDGHSGLQARRRFAEFRLVPPAHAGEIRLRRGGQRGNRARAAVADAATPSRTTPEIRRPTPRPRLSRACCSSAGLSGARSTGAPRTAGPRTYAKPPATRT
jgi:hypothetical protein